jgi:hypothetical protein
MSTTFIDSFRGQYTPNLWVTRAEKILAQGKASLLSQTHVLGRN